MLAHSFFARIVQDTSFIDHDVLGETWFGYVTQILKISTEMVFQTTPEQQNCHPLSYIAMKRREKT